MFWTHGGKLKCDFWFPSEEKTMTNNFFQIRKTVYLFWPRRGGNMCTSWENNGGYSRGVESLHQGFILRKDSMAAR